MCKFLDVRRFEDIFFLEFPSLVILSVSFVHLAISLKCDLPFVFAGAMTEHKKEKHGVKCKHCNYVGSSAGSLAMHMKNSHKSADKGNGESSKDTEMLWGSAHLFWLKDLISRCAADR